MDTDAKYFPKTAAALQALRETTSALEQTAGFAAGQNRELAGRLSALKEQIAEKSARLETVISRLNEALK